MHHLSTLDSPSFFPLDPNGRRPSITLMTPNHKIGQDAPPSPTACRSSTKAVIPPVRRRESKYASLKRDSGKEREKQRGVFFDKVRRKGEDRRFEAREEQVRL